MQYPNSFFRGARARLLAASSVAALIVVGLGAGVMLPHSEPAAAKPQVVHVAMNVPTRSAPPRMLENGAPFSFADLVERVSPAVVTVTVEEQLQQSASVDTSQLPEPFRDFFNQFGQGGGQQQPRKAISMGSGFVVDRSGFIVTNNHVVENGKKITVKFPDGREFDARLVGTDKLTDIAVLKIKSERPLPSVEFADDRQVRVGDWVIAVGNPFGLSNTVTAGIVSSIGRDIGNGPYTDFIQIDASINRGNSGGPTFDLQGKVIGMNTMIFSPSGGSVGIGFAIPSSTVREIVSQLEAHGKVSRGWLGVSIQAMTPELAASMGSKETKGAIVASVVPGGPAAKAGLHQGDVVLAVNGKSVEDNRDLTRRVAMLSAGSSATFTINRDGQQRNVTVTIGSRKEDLQVASNSGPQKNGGAEATGEALGLGLAAVTPEVRRTFGLEGDVSGVVVTKVDPNSDAADKSIEAGDVIEQVADQAVHTPKDVQARVAAAKSQGRKSVLVLVTGQAGQRFVALKIG
ncbi:MAG TPA: Do family serine endopeptidase [Rhizomicrobium sp.]|nr:Do family serine endopeptidase [Rhizomicrobium sp.]